MTRLNISRVSTMKRRFDCAAVLAVSLASCLLMQGCNDAQAGALLGAGAGALAGQAIGRDTTGTLIGTGVGAGLGYIFGNELDKSHHDQCRARYYDY